MYLISRRTISTWVKSRNQIEGVGKNSQIKREEISGNTQRVFWPELEERLHSEFLEQQKAGRSVRQGWFRIQSQFLFQFLYPNVNSSVFRFSNGWFRGFLGRHYISLRSIMKIAQKVPEDYKPLIVNWLRYNLRNSQPRSDRFWEVAIEYPVSRYQLSNICTVDKTPIPYEYFDGKTYNMTGEKTVWVKESRSGWDK